MVELLLIIVFSVGGVGVAGHIKNAPDTSAANYHLRDFSNTGECMVVANALAGKIKLIQPVRSSLFLCRPKAGRPA